MVAPKTMVSARESINHNDNDIDTINHSKTGPITMLSISFWHNKDGAIAVPKRILEMPSVSQLRGRSFVPNPFFVVNGSCSSIDALAYRMPILSNDDLINSYIPARESGLFNQSYSFVIKLYIQQRHPSFRAMVGSNLNYEQIVVGAVPVEGYIYEDTDLVVNLNYDDEREESWMNARAIIVWKLVSCIQSCYDPSLVE